MPADESTTSPTPGPTAAGGSGTATDLSAARKALADVPHEPGAPKPDPILVADGIVRQFGGLTAVDVKHVEIQRGRHHRPDRAQRCRQDDVLQPADRVRPARLRHLGVRRQGPQQGPGLQGRPARHGPHLPADQGALQADRHREHAGRRHRAARARRLFSSLFAPLWRRQEAANTKKADALLERFLLIKKREDFAGSLSGGQRKLLEMARALMTDPDLVMLDEPMAGVNPALKQSLLGHVKSLRDEGRTVLFVEHDMDMVRDISDWVIVMAQGQIVAEGPPDAVMGDQRVIDAYLGSHHDQDLSEEMEEKILAEAQAEIDAEHTGEHEEDKA